LLDAVGTTLINEILSLDLDVSCEQGNFHTHSWSFLLGEHRINADVELEDRTPVARGLDRIEDCFLGVTPVQCRGCYVNIGIGCPTGNGCVVDPQSLGRLGVSGEVTL
jgi:hypothetical protein